MDRALYKHQSCCPLLAPHAIEPCCPNSLQSRRPHKRPRKLLLLLPNVYSPEWCPHFLRAQARLKCEHEHQSACFCLGTRVLPQHANEGLSTLPESQIDGKARAKSEALGCRESEANIWGWRR